uniref:Lipase member H n=1 Tax=Aceria tosichella TaxID=561515 RepID=A0A6G1SI18_9ACAR
MRLDTIQGLAALLACQVILLMSLFSFSLTQDQCSNCTSRESRSIVPQQSIIEALFGQVAKTVVYSGATVARLNNRLLCTLLRWETDRSNQDQPTLFIFKSQLERDRAFRIYADDDITYDMLEEAQLDPDQATIILVHGWLGGLKNEFWLSEAKNVALGTSDELGLNRLELDPHMGEYESQQHQETYRPNVIVVDWSEFAQGSLYTATANSYKVARRLGRLLEQLARVGQLKPEYMHCLGHSIGAHICGQAARLAFPVQPQPTSSSYELASRYRFGRITALDPGGFCYELGIRNETKFPGLRPSDALLVDAYYSNRSPFGNMYQVAQYNVRLNNGFFQRPCSVWRNSTTATEYFRASVRFVLGNVGESETITCDHYFATRFAHQTLSEECSYVAYACDSYRNFVRGRCGYCNSPRQCYSMDFEYQRPEASNRHAMEHIERHSSLLNNQFNQATYESPPGGVPYGQRRAYYMRVANKEPYCSYTYRVRVVLNPDLPKLRTFRADSLQLQLVGIVTLKDPSQNTLTNGIMNLHGPWLDSNDKRDLGLNDVTLTGLFELTKPERIRGLMVVYDSERNRRNIPPFLRPIESIHFDYLSSMDPHVKAKFSSSFKYDEFEIKYTKITEAAAAGVAAAAAATAA